MANVKKELLQVLNSLDESVKFCTSGSRTPVLPGLEVKGVGPVGLPINPSTAKELIQQASQAPYGKGEETIVDTDVRRVWQIEPKQFKLTNPDWDNLMIDGIVESVKAEFVIPKEVKCDLYKLLIYEEDSFFAPHRDSEKKDGMFATLVVCLPCKHKGGTLLVTHNGKTEKIDFDGAQGEFNIQYAAFYTDCQHEIKPVKSGYRVCLVYNLSLAKEKRQPAAPQSGQKVAKAAEVLTELFQKQDLDKIAIPFSHEYTQAGLSPETLKGADRALWEVLYQAAQESKFHIYLSLLEYQQSGEADYDTMGWGFDFDRDSVGMGEVYEESLSLDHWRDAQGQSINFGEIELLEEELICQEGLEDFPYKQEVTEATGNEGVTVDRWYQQAVIVLWPHDRYFRILANEGQQAALPALEKMIAQAKKPAGDKECLAFAREILNYWRPHKYLYGKRDLSQSSDMLKLLEKLSDKDLVKRFLKEALPQNYSGTEGKVLVSLGNKLGWDTIKEGLTHFFSRQVPGNDNASLKATVEIFEGLCCSSGKMTSDRKALCQLLAREVESLIKQWDEHQPKNVWSRQKEDRTGVLESVAKSLAAIDEGPLLKSIITHACQNKKHYDLHNVLVPAVKKVHSWIDAKSPARDACEHLLNHCIAELEKLTEKPVEEPKDWTQNIKLKCSCADCKELQQFLLDPKEKVHRFSVRKDRRQHLHQVINSHGCDMDHVTERKGSPQTLVCTKNRATFHRLTKEFADNTELLKEMRGLTLPESKGKKSAVKKK